MRKASTKIPRQKHLVRPFKDGYMIVSAGYVCVEDIMRGVDVKCCDVRPYRFGRCCICGWTGVNTYKASHQNTLFYIPICRKCANFMWGIYGNKPYARIYYNAVETNRRKF